MVIATVVERATADAGLNDAASAQANTFDHYIGWAVNESKSQAFSALADLMDEGDPQLRNGPGRCSPTNPSGPRCRGRSPRKSGTTNRAVPARTRPPRRTWPRRSSTPASPPRDAH
ncbi:hypothetical protein GS531_24985 [Rhodococcus hoagii]|nr:hypothetical protein [Prescottella equi]